MKAFTPVCTTEMIAFAKANPYFERLNTCLLGLSVDSNPSHLAWIYDIYCRTGIVIPFPIIADRNGEIARKYGMISSTVNNTATVRNVFIIDDKQIVRTILVYPMNIGRNIPEILRVVRALQVADCNNQMAPVNWMPNEPMIVPMPQTFAQLQERNENIMKQQNGMNWYLSFKNPEKLCINEKCMQKEENRIIDEPKEPVDKPDAVSLSNVEGKVDFDNVSFGYVRDKMILKDISLSAKPGQVIAIVGETGAGKTTIINLLMRFYDIASGKISIDDKNYRDYKMSDLRKSFAMVLQDTWLFNGTVYENIAYGNENATRQQVIEAAKAAKIHRYIESLPDGYDTVLTENATNISKGQKQLLTIARAMLLDSSMLILDEATSNVDIVTEADISGAMVKLMKNKTCFVIAHRLSTIQNADRILVVKDGNIVEQGTHQELLDKKQFYYSMYNAQFS